MSRPYVGGINLEERLRTKLEGFCDLFHDQTYDHKYKLDFVVTRFKSIYLMRDQVGVQVTADIGNPRKRAEFLEAVERYAPTPRAVYLELDEQADVDGAGPVAYAALVSLVFDQAHQERRITGLRIRRDLSFAFFDLRTAPERPRSAPPRVYSLQPTPDRTFDITPEVGPTDGMMAATVQGERLEGEVRRYRPDQRYGFITCPQRPIDYYFNRENADPAVREAIDAEWQKKAFWPSNWTSSLSIPVTFTDNGFTRYGARNPEAIEVVMRATSEAAEVEEEGWGAGLS